MSLEARRLAVAAALRLADLEARVAALEAGARQPATTYVDEAEVDGESRTDDRAAVPPLDLGEVQMSTAAADALFGR